MGDSSLGSTKYFFFKQIVIYVIEGLFKEKSLEN